MSRYIVDSSVGLKAVIPEKDSDKAIALQEAGHELLAPDIYPLEAAHVISKLFRQRKITEDEAHRILEDILDARPAVKNSMRLLPRAFEISIEYRCAFWDALYVAMSESEGCPLITADERLVNNLGDKFNIIALSSF
jgi:predicted nucleic acid-binding protein